MLHQTPHALCRGYAGRDIVETPSLPEATTELVALWSNQQVVAANHGRLIGFCGQVGSYPRNPLPPGPDCFGFGLFTGWKQLPIPIARHNSFNGQILVELLFIASGMMADVVHWWVTVFRIGVIPDRR